jgi:hypothetical protein
MSKLQAQALLPVRSAAAEKCRDSNAAPPVIRQPPERNFDKLVFTLILTSNRPSFAK